MIPQPTQANTVGSTKSRCLYVHNYALELLRNKRITYTGLHLLSYGDMFISPYRTRWEQRDSDRLGGGRLHPLSNSDYEPVTSVTAKVPHLRAVLKCSDDTLLSTIRALHNLKPAVFRAERAGRVDGVWSWHHQTLPREFEPGYLFVPGYLMDLLCGEHHITFRECLLAAYVCSFVANERPCYNRNEVIGKQFGLAGRTVQCIISPLVNAGVLTEYKVNERRYLGMADEYHPLLYWSERRFLTNHSAEPVA